MKKWSTVLAILAILAIALFTAVLATTAFAQDTDKPSGKRGDSVKLDAADTSAFLTLDLNAGFPLDPFFVSVNGGGDVDANTLDESCVGFVSETPVVTLNWEGEVDSASVFFYSDHDPTLVIEMPDGSYLCNDDAHRNLLDSIVNIKEPPQGEYHIWVGSFDEGNLIPGVLVITTKDEYSVGDFDLSSFVKRKKLARNPVTVERVLPEATVLRTALADALEAKQNEATALDADLQTITTTVVVTGETPAFMLPVADESPAQLCSGLINDEADALFSLAEETATLNVFFAAKGDSTLAVVGPDGAAHCVDNSSDEANLNPALSIANAQPGVYGVVIGRFDPSVPVTGTLTIDISGKLQPPVLAPEIENP